MKRLLFVCFPIAVSIFLSSCSELQENKEFTEKLRDNISAKYETEEIKINSHNSQSLVVILADSDFSELTPREKDEIAKEIGTIVKDLNGNVRQFKSGLVQFVEADSYLIAKRNSTETFQMFFD